MLKEERVRDEIKNAAFSQSLMLGHCYLHSIPMQIFTDESLLNLRRLDLSNNGINVIPSTITNLTNLRELWLQHNPIEEFIVHIHQMTKLEVIDISHTKIKDIPIEMALLVNVYDWNWKNTPLAINLKEQQGIEVNDLVQFKEYLILSNTRKDLESSLFEVLYGEHFLMDADKPHVRSRIKKLVQKISVVFEDLEDLRVFVKRVEKLLPSCIDDIKDNTPEHAKELFYQLRRDTDRQRLGADVEIKIRGMYFDKIERSDVVILIDSIYKYVESLEDMQFLVKYAPLVLPEKSQNANGKVIWDNIVKLQNELTEKREVATKSFANALIQLYPEQKPETVIERATEIAKFLQIERFATKSELVKMSQLTAECSKIFPPDFVSVVNEDIISLAKETIFKK